MQEFREAREDFKLNEDQNEGDFLLNEREFLLNEYSFMQKSYELQFNHFMGVFYFWTIVITVPIGANIIANLGISGPSKFTAFGSLSLFIAIIGIFLSAKMFDIRRSQIRYLERINQFRVTLWENYKLEEKLKIQPMGKDVNLIDVARRDFGMYMAWVMSLIHGVLVTAGSFYLLRGLSIIYPFIISVILGLVVFGVNVKIYFGLVTKKVKVT